MTVKMTPELEAKIDAMVSSGRFPDEAAVLDAAVQLLEDREQSENRLRELLRVGEEQADRGELVEYDANFMKRLGVEALERSRLGLPVKDEVKP